MADADFNSFLLIELDPDTTDQKEIDEAIRKKQAKWTRETNTSPRPDVKRAAQKNLDRLTAIKACLHNPDDRAKAAKAAKALIKKEKAAKRQDFEDQVELLSKGNVTDQAVKNLARKFKRFYYTEEDVRNALRSFEARADTAAPAKAKQALDPTIAKDIRTNLQLLDEASLYTFLGVSTTASLSAIQAKMEAADRDLKAAKISPENDTKRSLISYCRSVFKKQSERERYNQTLILEQSGPFIELINNCCDTGSIEIGHVLLLFSKITTYSLDQTQACALIKQRAKKRKVPINVDLSFDFKRQIRCACQHKNEALQETCTQCRKKLYQACPQCSKATPVDQLACSCGFSIKASFKALKEAIDIGDDTAVLRLWDEAYRAHPAFHALTEAYDALRDRARQQQEHERALQAKYQQIENAIARNDDAAIRRLWHDALLRQIPSLKALLLRIEQAHQPADVQAVEATHFGSYIQVTWQTTDILPWYLVCWSSSAYVRQPSDGKSQKITRGTYEREGFRIENLTARAYYITVFVGTTFRGKEILSPGTSAGSRALVVNQHKIRISYALSIKGLWKKRARLTLKANQDLYAMPELVLVAQQGIIMPTSRDSGVILKCFSDLTLLADVEHVSEFDLEGLSKPTRFRLFTALEKDETRVELAPLSSRQLTL